MTNARRTDTKAISDALTRLRLSVAASRMPEDDAALQLAIYVNALRQYPIRAIEQACSAIAMKARFWPNLAELVEACDQAKADLDTPTAIGGPVKDMTDRLAGLGWNMGRIASLGIEGTRWISNGIAKGMIPTEVAAGLDNLERYGRPTPPATVAPMDIPRTAATLVALWQSREPNPAKASLTRIWLMMVGRAEGGERAIVEARRMAKALGDDFAAVVKAFLDEHPSFRETGIANVS
jgi:hypothetical protein